MKIKGIHIRPEKGHIGDPNGLIYFKGLYHVFYQHCPILPATHVKRWGHAVSKNLLEWEDVSPAILPDSQFDNGGVWSGSAIEKDGIMYLFYTGLKAGAENGGIGKFGICLATSKDGFNFEKYAGNPIIAECPRKDLDSKFRDPSVFEYNGEYYMFLASEDMLAYKSKDLLNWEYIGIPIKSGAIECPDINKCNGKYLLAFSQGKLADIKTTVKFAYGDFNGQKFVPEIAGGPELGPHFYASQSFVDGKGRNIMFAWMFAYIDGVIIGNGNQTNPNAIGELCIPREVTVKNGKIYSFPPEEFRHRLKDTDKDVIVTKSSVKLNVPWDKPLEYKAKKITDVKIFREGNCLEVFINHGEAVFSYLY